MKRTRKEKLIESLKPKVDQKELNKLAHDINYHETNPVKSLQKTVKLIMVRMGI